MGEVRFGNHVYFIIRSWRILGGGAKHIQAPPSSVIGGGGGGRPPCRPPPLFLRHCIWMSKWKLDRKCCLWRHVIPTLALQIGSCSENWFYAEVIWSIHSGSECTGMPGFRPTFTDITPSIHTARSRATVKTIRKQLKHLQNEGSRRCVWVHLNSMYVYNLGLLAKYQNAQTKIS